MSTPCKLFVAQMQDYLAVGEEGHMNRPGTASGNWQWRMKAGAATDELACKIREMTKYYGRG